MRSIPSSARDRASGELCLLSRCDVTVNTSIEDAVIAAREAELPKMRCQTEFGNEDANVRPNASRLALYSLAVRVEAINLRCLRALSTTEATDMSRSSLGQQCPGLFVTGTDTGIGKTFISALIAREVQLSGRQVGVFKPACSGAEVGADGADFWPDLNALRESTASTASLDEVCPYRLREPLAPPVAARRAGVTIDFDVMLTAARRQRERHEFVVIEGVGGWLCPLTDRHLIADFAAALGLPVVIVARRGLGTINHTLLTIESIQRRGLQIAGVILNDVLNEGGSVAAETNLDELSKWALRGTYGSAICVSEDPSERGEEHRVSVLGVVPFGGQTVCLSGSSEPARIDWQQLAKHPR